MTRLARSVTVARAIFIAKFPSLLGGQDVQLPTQNQALRSPIAHHDKLSEFSLNPYDMVVRFNSPDAAALQILDDAASGGADRLRVYENIECAGDRAMLKPLLLARLQLYSRLLKIDAERAALAINNIKLPANSKKALEVRDVLVASKKELDAVTVSLM